ncbi:MAG: aminopeptidase P N-terminal domain-containing protein [Chitinophaga sp.]|uniref:aminopeptidase P N-terminal domain-containing protein n=1 Tax=Chitinophaga sp. TaxID=1869181 RepID=UPI001B1ED8CD|nr:aminopeptidase P N-terminal domain-containing protein [Chitinophaga sp.]MBO9728834.1 aminopeptidase P N-terminal domain-containing protein [Chitinophaga sp.]
MFSTQRQRLVSQLPPDAVAILTANDIMPTNEDGTMRYVPNSNLYYLTGIKEDDAMLVLCPQHPEPSLREILFIRRTDQLYVKWLGHRLDKAAATKISGIDTVFFTDEYDVIMKKVIPLCRRIFLYSNEHARSENETQTREDRLLLDCRRKFPLHEYDRLYPLLGRQRMSKTPEEIALMRQACKVSGAGFRRLLKFIKPGKTGYQVAAEMIHEYMQHHTTWAGYEPIVAFGADTCILHYRANETAGKDGDLVLIDAAASQDLYNADLTRTIPVNGRYTARQRAYYDAVLHVHHQVRQQVRAGIAMKEVWQASNELILEALCQLGLCTPNDIRRNGEAFYLQKYSYHNVSHFIGLDVHDPAWFHEPLPVGAVITNEPGIYNAEEGIGIRIENNLLVTINGCEDLMEDIPKEAEEIEELMN